MSIIVEVKQEEDVVVQVIQEEIKVIVQPIEVVVETATIIPTGIIEGFDVLDGGTW